jgi:hypothetical protein
MLRRNLIAAMLFFASVSFAAVTSARDEVSAKEPAKPQIEMAILLDTSGSMSGLINQARTQLWKIVNEFAASKRDGQRPDVKVALYEYGKSSLPGSENYIRMIVPLTTDLDKISEELFKLETNGGSEYCGAVIGRAVEELAWSENRRDLRCIFIAGNEPFTQGPVDFRVTCKAAADQNITVSTIHCGDHQVGINTMWAEGAKLADGSYMSIDHNAVTPDIAAPQDKKLAELNAEINKTYIAYGSAGERKEALQRQVAQDANASGANASSFAERAKFKASGAYQNAHWDLGDAVKQGKVDLAELKEDQLPENMKKMSVAERQVYVKELSAKRAALQEEIQTLSKARDAFIAEKRKEMAEETGDTLDAAVINAARKQAEKQDFRFEK